MYHFHMAVNEQPAAYQGPIDCSHAVIIQNKWVYVRLRDLSALGIYRTTCSLQPIIVENLDSIKYYRI